MKNAANQLPTQVTGRATDFVAEGAFEDLASAHAAFQQASMRLLTVNDWHEYTGTGSARFTLCNDLGDELTGFAKQGLYIKVDLPAPGPDAGDGSEWVMIENVSAAGAENAAEEYLLFTARPAPDPRGTATEIAHFFTEGSTSTFIVRRDGRVVSAGAHGRNESPNNEQVDLHDKIRNTTIALMARMGLSGGQWQRLVNGILTYAGQ